MDKLAKPLGPRKRQKNPPTESVWLSGAEAECAWEHFSATQKQPSDQKTRRQL